MKPSGQYLFPVRPAGEAMPGSSLVTLSVMPLDASGGVDAMLVDAEVDERRAEDCFVVA